MSNLTDLTPAGVWRLFDLICRTPHPSRHEEMLAKVLTAEAVKHGLTVKRDDFGNMRIDRPASPGMEDKCTFLLQAHLDMVPQKAPGSSFDFLKDPLPVVAEGNIVSCQGKTTLGADNGIGVALALDLLEDPDFKCGPLAAIFTLEEEVGLNGARELDPNFLRGDYLINLDAAEEFFCVGCAGGVETYGTFTPEYRETPAGNAFKIFIRGLAGGHSGAEIHTGRGNAHKFMGEFLGSLGEYAAIASLSGGNVVNAISRESSAVIITEYQPEVLQALADTFADRLRQEFNATPDFGFEVEECAVSDRVWSMDFQKRILNTINSMPDGVINYSKELNAVQTSTNLGVIRMENDGRITMGCHPRSFDDSQWEELSNKICRIMEGNGAVTRELTPYPGWKYNPDSPLIPAAKRVYKEISGVDLPVSAIHAGLETGLISKAAPHLAIIAFGAACYKLHTTEEYLDIRSTQYAARWLRGVISSF